jgi:phosphopantothenate--cysteine ligase
MKILLTAGGTAEPIDQVRAITNHSSGGLGKNIAEHFLAHGHQVTYVTTKQALRPATQAGLTLYEIESTANLKNQLEQLFAKTQYDNIIHSMAVSDFTTETAIPEAELIQKMIPYLQQLSGKETTEKLAEILSECLNAIGEQPQSANKISSKTERLLLFLKKNPKIIAMIREKQPQTILVGFKLLVAVPQKELLAVAKQALIKNQCDFVFANDLQQVHAKEHHGFLLHKDGSVASAHTKQEIAQLIVQNVENAWRKP